MTASSAARGPRRVPPWVRPRGSRHQPRLPLSVPTCATARSPRAPAPPRAGTPRPHPEDGDGQPDLGVSAHRQRVAQARHRGRESDRRALHDPPTHTALPDPACVPRHARQRPRLYRLLHRRHGALRDPVRATHPRPRTTARAAPSTSPRTRQPCARSAAVHVVSRSSGAAKPSFAPPSPAGTMLTHAFSAEWVAMSFREGQALSGSRPRRRRHPSASRRSSPS